jgi:hypothetical protein
MAPEKRVRKEDQKRVPIPLEPKKEIPAAQDQDAVNEQQHTLETEVEMLRRQVAALTEEVRRNRLPVNNSCDGSEDAMTNFENPFVNPQRGRHVPMHMTPREERRWEPSIKAELPEFQGT